MKNYFTKEVRIALVVLVAICALFAGMNFLKGIIVLSDDLEYKVLLKDVKGLSASSPIYADGYKVGVVRNIAYDYDGSNGGILVSVDVDKNLRIPAGSSAEVVSDLMGNVQLNLLLANNPRERIEPGGVIEGIVNNGAMGQLQALIPYVENLILKLDSILVSVNTLLSNPALARTLENTADATGNIAKSTAELNRLMVQINKELPGMMNKADNTLANTEVLTSNLSQIDIAATMADVNETLRNVKELTAKLNSTEGTVGKFLNDPGIYDNMNKTVMDVDSLVKDLKHRPNRYVHFSIFGKKVKD